MTNLVEFIQRLFLCKLVAAAGEVFGFSLWEIAFLRRCSNQVVSK